MNPPQSGSGQIAGQLLPLAQAEQLIQALASVVSARIVPDDNGGIGAVHVLVSGELTPKQVVRNVESALMAQLGLRVDHRKISVAATVKKTPPPLQAQDVVEEVAIAHAAKVGRALYFEDVEIRGSHAKGFHCRVTLRRGSQQLVGEADGMDGDRGRVEMAARATVQAIALAETGGRKYALEGVKVVSAFDREVVLAGVTVRQGRGSSLLTGSCPIRESGETAGVLAVLDATNRWMAAGKDVTPQD